jgi:hypothetical protein
VDTEGVTSRNSQLDTSNSHPVGTGHRSLVGTGLLHPLPISRTSPVRVSMEAVAVAVAAEEEPVGRKLRSYLLPRIIWGVLLAQRALRLMICSDDRDPTFR